MRRCALPGTKVLMKSGSAIHEAVARARARGSVWTGRRWSPTAACPASRSSAICGSSRRMLSYFATILVRWSENLCSRSFRGSILAGTNSGCGKTTVTCAVLQALVNRGLAVVAAANAARITLTPCSTAASSARKARISIPFSSTSNTLRYPARAERLRL